MKPTIKEYYKVFDKGYNKALEEVEKMIDNNCKCFCPNYDVLKKELEEMKKQ